MQKLLPRLPRFAVLALCLLAGANLHAQYFGQNKVRHQVLHFKVLKTQHFDIYYYPEEQVAAEEVGRMAERWNTRLSQLLHHVLTSRQTVVLYASHTDFQQTTVVPGFIGEGTGGVTLGLGRKVVLPLAGSLAATDHVLGHELVHAFQYDMTTTRGSPVPGAARLPLWFIEGMAEYLSIGPKDSSTAMWMRDALALDKFPTVKDLDNPNKYFPYRYGEALWAFIGGRYGDDKVGPMLVAAGQSGSVDQAIQAVLHVSAKQLSEEWKQAVEAKNRPILQATQPVAAANVLIAAHKGTAGLNVSPALSPDGKWVMFFSERGLFSIDLYLANAETGKVVRQITSTAISSHFNNLEFINSAGAWAPDSQRFAFGHVEGGKANISIYDVTQNRIIRRYAIPDAGEIFSPTWSPNGHQIAFSAIEGGLTNLYLLNLDNGAVRKLTNDNYAELQPAWSPDGSRIAFVTDRFTTDLGDLSHSQYKLALMDMANGAIQEVSAAGGGDQINPQWSPDGHSLYYVSDASGIPNIYRLPLAGGAPEQLTNLQSGVSGITALSPALAVAQKTGAVVYSAFSDNLYSLVRLPEQATPVTSTVAALHPALLAPWRTDSGVIADYLRNAQTGLATAASFTTHPYHPSLHLDYIAPPAIAVGVSNYGTQLGGGTALHFSDLLGYRNLTVAVESLTDTGGGGGFLRNLSGSAVFTNDHHRWTWGIGGGQTPFATGSYGVATGVINGRPVAQEERITQWEMNRSLVGIASYPFSRAQRLEFTGGYENIGFAAEQRVQVVDLATGNVLATQKQDLPAAPALNFAVGTAALVYDTSIFGGVSPVRGQSYRLQAGINAGSIDFSTLLVDYRRYLGLTQSFSLAGRLLTFGRYGGGADDPRMQQMFVGYPEMVRGYDFNSFSTSECGPNFAATGACPALDRLIGSKIGVISLEARLELFGPLGVVRSPMIPPIEVAPFFDAGVAWTAADKPNFFGGARHPVSSEGIAFRVNLLGYAVASVSYAIPNQRPGVSHVWEFTLQPGF